MKKLSMAIVNRLAHSENYTSDQREQMVFALESILSDMSKSLVLFILFSTFGYGMYFIVVYMATVLIRTNIGGFHMTGYWKCFAFSSLYFTGMLIPYLYIQLPFTMMIGLAIVSLLIQWFIAPVSTPQREQLRNVNRKAFKMKAMAISFVIMMLHIIINNPYTAMGLWVVVIQTLFIVIYKGAKLYEKNVKSIM